MVEERQTIKLCTFNILHPDFALQERYPGCGKEYLIWSYRLPLIHTILRRDTFDIILLQETNAVTVENDFKSFDDYYLITQNTKSQIRNIKKWLALLEKGEPPIKKPNTLVCSTLLRKERFNIEKVESGSRTLITTVFDKVLKQSIQIVNLHLEALADQFPVRIKHLETIAKDPHLCKIIAGDFNDFPNTPTLEFLKEKGYKYGYVRKRFPRATFRSRSREDVIDHLFCTDCFSIEMTYEDIRGIPTSKHPSDHLPVCFTLHLKMAVIPVEQTLPTPV